MLEKLPDAIGRALADKRAGLAQTMFETVDPNRPMAELEVTSTAFVDRGPLPQRCTADGDGRSPPLAWRGVPADASEIVIVAEDADSPTPLPFVHAIVHGLPGGDGDVAEGQLSNADIAGNAEVAEVALGRNSLLGVSWIPPDPPPAHGIHRYVFQVFALGAGEPLPATPGRDAVREAVDHRGVARGWIIGLYERPPAPVLKVEGVEIPAPPPVQPV